MKPQPIEFDREMEQLAELVASGNKDSEALRLARQRGDAIRQEVKKKYGQRRIAVELVQQGDG
jgi:hypothetical protein